MKTWLRGMISLLLVGSAWPAASSVRLNDGGTSGGGRSENGSGPTFWCRDADGDGYGDGAQIREGITAPPGYVANDGDCNDIDPTIYPKAEELCDGKWDHLPEAAFMYVGGIQEAAEQAERMAKA